VGEDPLACRLKGNFSSIVKEQQNPLPVYPIASPEAPEGPIPSLSSPGQPLVLSPTILNVSAFMFHSLVFMKLLTIPRIGIRMVYLHSEDYKKHANVAHLRLLFPETHISHFSITGNRYFLFHVSMPAPRSHHSYYLYRIK
jgi:hypothetical protein